MSRSRRADAVVFGFDFQVNAAIVLFLENVRDILITDKIFFLDAQVFCRKMYSVKTTKCIEKALINYLDKHKKALDDGIEPNIAPTTNGNIRYCYWQPVSIYLLKNR